LISINEPDGRAIALCTRKEDAQLIVDATNRAAGRIEKAQVVAFDGGKRTVTLRLDLMPCVAIGDEWRVMI
jgi:hypothetical protein